VEPAEGARRLALPALPGGAVPVFEHVAGGWRLTLEGAGRVAATITEPLRIELFRDGSAHTLAGTYERVTRDGQEVAATGTLSASEVVRFVFSDRWWVQEEGLRLDRTVTVAARGDSSGAFLSSLLLPLPQAGTWLDVEPFAPGSLYGASERVDSATLGSRAHYREGVRRFRIREDRLPAPLIGVRAADGASLALLNPVPRGETIQEEVWDLEGERVLVDERFGFASMGTEEEQGQLALGVWFPGTEGEVTYPAQNGAVRIWRRRYHPVRDGLVQRYSVVCRLGSEATFPDFVRAAWRWAWSVLEPEVVTQDIGAAREAIVTMLADRVVDLPGPGIQAGARACIPTAWDAVTSRMGEPDDQRLATMGFISRNTEAAYFLLRAAADREASDPAGAARLRALGVRVLDTFATLHMAPPEAEGFDPRDGSRVTSIYRGARQENVHLRALAEGARATLRAWRRESTLGRDQPAWLAWALTFARWLTGRQAEDGSFPRAWVAGTNRAGEESPHSTHCAIPFLVEAATCSGDGAYLRAAERAGDFSWHAGHARAEFVGGTLDNANVVDKEAAGIALAAYLALYEATQEPEWLERARAAADVAETWIYLWNVPMPVDARPEQLHWHPGATTVGLQLIATGHSWVDHFMAFDAPSFARLARHTGDQHYRDVARLILHNTKSMLALPGRTFDLAGPGWEQEHWSLVTRRGCGEHRLWLTWLACAHLESIYGMASAGAEASAP
jgi:hypothetical protein